LGTKTTILPKKCRGFQPAEKGLFNTGQKTETLHRADCGLENGVILIFRVRNPALLSKNRLKQDVFSGQSH
jgi:hypothetical protein